MSEPTELHGLKPGSRIEAKGHVWTVSGRNVLTPEKFDLGMDQALAVIVPSDYRVVEVGATDQGSLPPLVDAQGIWTGSEFKIEKLIPGVETPNYWWSPNPVFSGPVPPDAVRWSLAAQVDGRAQLDDDEIEKLLSFRFLPTQDGRTVLVAVTTEIEWAKARLRPIFGSSLIVRGERWQKAEFEAASGHIGANRSAYNVILNGIRVAANGSLELYVLVSFMVDSLRSWAAGLPDGMATFQSWIRDHSVAL